VDAIAACETEEQILALALAGATETTGAARGFLLRPETHLAEPGLAGALAVELQGTADAAALWLEVVKSGGMDAMAPELTSRLRTVRFPFRGRDDASLTSWRSAQPACVEEGYDAAHPVWRERLGVAGHQAIPILSENKPAAMIVLETGRPAPDPATLRLVAHAGRALERVRLSHETKLRRAQLATLRETARMAAEAQTLPATLHRLTKAAAQTLGARGAGLWLTENGGRQIVLHAAYGADDENENRARADELSALAEACVFQRESALLADASEDTRLGAGGRRLGPVVSVPLPAQDRLRGALVLYGREEASRALRPFEREDQDLLASFAALASSLVEQAGLAERVAQAERRLDEARKNAARAENLAHLGEVSVRMAREMSGPAASILGFARRVHRSLPEGDAHREYLEIVVRESERLERMVAEHLQFAALHRFHLGLASLNHIVQACLQRSAAEVAKKRVRLLKKLSVEVPPLLLDEEKIELALTNALANALEAVSSGGCIRVETRLERGQAVVEVAHDGPPPAGELLDHLFVPFATGGRAGQGIGLSVAQRIVRDHGGEVGVRREGDWGQVLTLTLPVRGNEDRRQKFDRRGVRGDRRNRMGG
jgi:signal transduction histidine kinase